MDSSFVLFVLRLQNMLSADSFFKKNHHPLWDGCDILLLMINQFRE
jgi:hypothetical protein